MKLLAPFVLIFVVLLTVVYLDDEPTKADIVFVSATEIFTLDPQRMSWTQDIRMAYAIYEGLVRWNNYDFTIEPAAATWTLSQDKLTYTFKIRPDAKWSNGDPLTAHDFIYAWRRALLPDSAADYTTMFFVIEGAEEFFNWRVQKLKEFTANKDNLTSAQRATAAAKLWRETESRFDEVTGLEAVDEHTLRVKLARPTSYFLDLAAFGIYYPVYRPCVEGWVVDNSVQKKITEQGWINLTPPPFEQRRFVKLNPDTARIEQKHGWTKPAELVSNGPYLLTDWRYKRIFRIERNPYYHSQEMIQNDSVAVTSIEDINTAILAFESGRIDWLTDVGAEYEPDMLAERLAFEKQYADELKAKMDLGMSLDEAIAELPKPEPGQRRNIQSFPTFGTDFYSFNCRAKLADGRDNPFADARIRRAFVLSVDKQSIVENVTRLNEPVTTTLVPIGSIPGYVSPQGLPYDLDRAREEFKNAGWEDRDGDGLVENAQGENFPIIDLLYSSNTVRYKNMSIALRDMWQRALGVRIELRGKDSKFFKDDLIKGNFMIGRGRWYGDYGDPTTFLDLFKTGDGNNDRGYSNKYVDDLLAQAANETDPAKRMNILAECERFLFQEEVPMLVICQLVQSYMYEPGKLTGLSPHPRLVQYLWQMKVNER
ncbi:MAG: peptide ABC transporter substrate-binding protein [Planctomycetes bacterium]|nr:peptide ABC transporter substrate-binding protein [Planctomycetota bacterium]